jgi:hypothetical protein
MSLNIVFPHLIEEGYRETSPATSRYNCIAWAVGATDAWWWPSPFAVHYWPEGVPREETLEAFVQAAATRGFVPAEDALLEPGFEKLAFYARDGKPTHAARQLSDGSWTSKLGKHVDISHTLRGVEGPVYGQVVGFMKRSLPTG